MSLPRNPLAPTNSLIRSLEKKSTAKSTPTPRPELRETRSLVNEWSPKPQSTVGSVISLRNVNPDIPLRTVLAQVRGGAIERVHRTNDLLIVNFLDRKAAERFYKFAKLGQFIVEGEVMMPEAPDISMRQRSPELEKAISRGARRVLKISRPVSNSSDCRLLYSKMNMLRMEKIFEFIGPIVSVQPMFSRNEVSFQIMFIDIENAIRSMRLFDRKSELFEPFIGWTLSYSTDPTEKGCYISL